MCAKNKNICVLQTYLLAFFVVVVDWLRDDCDFERGLSRFNHVGQQAALFLVIDCVDFCN